MFLWGCNYRIKYLSLLRNQRYLPSTFCVDDLNTYLIKCVLWPLIITIYLAGFNFCSKRCRHLQTLPKSTWKPEKVGKMGLASVFPIFFCKHFNVGLSVVYRYENIWRKNLKKHEHLQMPRTWQGPDLQNIFLWGAHNPFRAGLCFSRICDSDKYQAWRKRRSEHTWKKRRAKHTW